MHWIDDLKRQLHAGSIIASANRVAKAKRKYKAMLAGLEGTRVSSVILRERIGLKRPHDSLRVMARLGMIKRVRFVPAHWEYEVTPEDECLNS